MTTMMSAASYSPTAQREHEDPLALQDEEDDVQQQQQQELEQQQQQYDELERNEGEQDEQEQPLDDSPVSSSVPLTPSADGDQPDDDTIVDNTYTVDPSIRAEADALAAQLASSSLAHTQRATTTSLPTRKGPFVLDTTIHVRLDRDHHFSQSFDPLIFRKLAQTLATNHDLPLKVSALETCIELSRRVQNIRQLIDQGVFEELVINSGDEEVRVKHLATLALVEITKHRAGRDHAFTTSLVSSFASLLIDPHASVRLHVTTILHNLSLFSPFLLHPISASSLRHKTDAPPCLLALLVERIALEKDAAVRHGCLRVVIPMLRKPDGWKVARLANIIPICADSLVELAPQLSLPQPSGSSSSSSTATPLQPHQRHHIAALHKLAASLCECIAYTSIAHTSKLQSVSCDLVALLFRLVASTDAPLRVQAAAALRNVTIAEDGKRAGVACGGIEVALERVPVEQDAQALIGVLQTLAHLVECPEGHARNDRMVTQPQHIQNLRNLIAAHTPKQPQVAEYAKIALDRILWKP